jgi:Dihaem cytochrome c
MLGDRMSSFKRHLHRASSPRRTFKPRKSVWVLLVLLLLWSLCLGIGLAQATEPIANHLRNQVASLGGAIAPTDSSTPELPLSNEADSVAVTSVAVTPGTTPPATGDRPATISPVPITSEIGTVDVVPARYQAGQKLYLDNCATCHLGLPPAVMPTETWRQLIQDPEHYGATIRPLVPPELQITWQYLRDFSRPHETGEEIPYRVRQSKFFKALHPRVKFTEKVTLTSCNSCHIGADNYNFRTLSAEWQNAP